MNWSEWSTERRTDDTSGGYRRTTVTSIDATRTVFSVATPNANASAERFVRSIKEECLKRVIPFGERHHRRAVAEFVAHYHRERNHQGLDNELIDGEPAKGRVGRVRRHQRLGGLLNYYARAA
jgi:Integrase core domain